MSILRSVAFAFRTCLDFAGRVNRKIFWRWLGFALLIYLVALSIDSAFGHLYRALIPGSGACGECLPYEDCAESCGYLASAPLLSLLWLAICAIPFLSLIVRRMHDHGRSAWWALTLLPLPFWLAARGQREPNQYG